MKTQSIYSPAPALNGKYEDIRAILGIELRKVEDLLKMGFTRCGGQDLVERRKELISIVGDN